jgi:hypothetical protein
MELKRIAAAAALTVAMAAPAFAQPAPRSAAAQHRLHQQQMYRQAYGGYRYGGQGTGFWPGDVAAGIVGGAIGTAGAIAAAPFGAGPYAYYSGPYPGERDGYGYAAPNGFVCEPGYRC